MREALHVLWLACGVTGAVSLASFTLLGMLALAAALRDRARNRALQDHPRRKPRLPLFALRALTWRKRRRSPRCVVLADNHLRRPLDDRERDIWGTYEREIRR